MYKIFATDTFKKLYSTLDNNEQAWIQKIKRSLIENPTGKPLYLNWFREKKFLNKRLYFLIDEDTKRILLISFAPKKDQQKVIDFVKSNMHEFLDLLRNL